MSRSKKNLDFSRILNYCIYNYLLNVDTIYSSSFSPFKHYRNSWKNVSHFFLVHFHNESMMSMYTVVTVMIKVLFFHSSSSSSSVFPNIKKAVFQSMTSIGNTMANFNNVGEDWLLLSDGIYIPLSVQVMLLPLPSTKWWWWFEGSNQ